jgi:hypothetical protein
VGSKKSKKREGQMEETDITNPAAHRKKRAPTKFPLFCNDHQPPRPRDEEEKNRTEPRKEGERGERERATNCGRRMMGRRRGKGPKPPSPPPAHHTHNEKESAQVNNSTAANRTEPTHTTHTRAKHDPKERIERRNGTERLLLPSSGFCFALHNCLSTPTPSPLQLYSTPTRIKLVPRAGQPNPPPPPPPPPPPTPAPAARSSPPSSRAASPRAPPAARAAAAHHPPPPPHPTTTTTMMRKRRIMRRLP